MNATRLVLAACAVAAIFNTSARAQEVSDGRIGSGLECVPFARQISGIQVFGNASTWWRGAAGRYAEGATPKIGAVLVFRPTTSIKLGHVAVVSRIVSPRILMITHANWSRIGGLRGQVERDVSWLTSQPQTTGVRSASGGATSRGSGRPAIPSTASSMAAQPIQTCRSRDRARACLDLPPTSSER